MNDIGFIEYLRHADLVVTWGQFSSGKQLLFSLGACGVLSVLLGLAVIGTTVRADEPTWIPGILGLVAFALALLGLWIGYRDVHQLLAMKSGPINHGDLTEGVSRAMVGPIIGLGVFLLGILGSGITMLLAKTDAGTGGPEPQS